MLRKNYLILITLVLVFSSQALLAKGAKITLHLKNGEQQRGELYSVSDSALIVSLSKAGKSRFAEIKSDVIGHVVVDKKPDLLLLLRDDQ